MTPNEEKRNSLIDLANENSKVRPVLEFIEEHYNGSTEKLIKGSTDLFDLVKTIKNFKKKSPVNSSIMACRHGLPFFASGFEFALKLRAFIKNSKLEQLINKNRDKIIREKLKLGDNELFSCRGTDFDTSIIQWMLSSPKTDYFKIQEYIKYENGEIIENISELKYGSLFIVIDFSGKKIMWNVNFSTILGEKYIEESLMYSSVNFKRSSYMDFENSIVSEYIKSFNIKENTLILQSHKILPVKRRKENREINQIDVDKIINDIQTTLDSGCRRGKAFIGKQGTGKSLIIRKIEEKMTDYIVLHISVERTDINKLESTFNVIKNLQPLIVVFEDFDSFGLDKRSPRVGSFINHMDSVENAVFLFTVNDTTMVHNTIIGRPQRSDDIIEIKSPSTKEEVYAVMKSSFNVFEKKLETSFLEIGLISKDSYELCLSNNFTQATITSAIEKTFVELFRLKSTDKKIDHVCINESVLNSLLSLKKSKDTLSKYKFSHKLQDEECHSTK